MQFVHQIKAPDKKCFQINILHGLGGLVVSALGVHAGYCGFESHSGWDNFQTISTPSSYSTCLGLSMKWTGRRLGTDSDTKCAWVIQENKAVQIHVYNNRHCLHVPLVPGSIKNPYSFFLHENMFWQHIGGTSVITGIQNKFLWRNKIWIHFDREEYFILNLTTGKKYCGKEEKLLLGSNFSSFPQYFQYISNFNNLITYTFVKWG